MSRARTVASVAIVVLLAVAIGVALRARNTVSVQSPNPGTVLAVEESIEISQLSAGDGHVVWSTSFEEVGVGDVFQIEVGAEEKSLVARGSLVPFGLASAGGWVMYSVLRQDARELLARTHDGSRTVVLSSNVIGSIDSLGSRVAWPEQAGRNHRVVVRDMTTGEEWVAATLPRCEEERCFRIDAVALADRGVSFARGAVGAHPSEIVRREFDDEQTTVLMVPNDPQPDLLPSSAGPLFFSLRTGLRRWDFGWNEAPRAEVPQLGAGETVLGYADGFWLVLTSVGSLQRVYARRENEPQQLMAEPPPPVKGLDPGRRVASLRALTWETGQVIAIWALEELSTGPTASVERDSVIIAEAELPT